MEKKQIKKDTERAISQKRNTKWKNECVCK